jgi:alpha-mannosidase
LRNTTGTNFNWFTGDVSPPDGTDPGVHVLDYAFRVPTGLGLPGGGAPLAESLRFQRPMRAVVPPLTSSGKLPEIFSLASVTSSDATQPFITVAKLGSANSDQFIFRVYQPSNNVANPPTLTVSLAGLAQLLEVSSLSATPVTALEATIEGASALPATPSFDFSANTALATFAVTS